MPNGSQHEAGPPACIAYADQALNHPDISSPPNGRPTVVPHDVNDAPSPPIEPLLVASPQISALHLPVREPVQTRGRAQSAASRPAPSRGPTPAAQPKHSFDGPERKAASPYTHHRQTSIVHGLPHSRITGHAPALSMGPLSSQAIHAMGSKEAASHVNGVVPVLSVRKSPSTSTLNGLAAGSSSPAVVDVVAVTPNRRIERMHSGRIKRDPEHHPSQPRHQHPQPELTTVGEYALHHLFNDFIKEADDRIDRCMAETNEAIVNIETICGPGADLAFDQLIKALGHIVRQRPKSLIDAVMIWRRGKSEISTNLYNELQRVKSATGQSSPSQTNGTVRRLQDFHSTTNSSSASLATSSNVQRIARIEQSIRQAERRSAISVYILCRVLSEIITQCRSGTLSDDTAERLEDVIFVQVRNTDAESLLHSSIKQTQWSMFGQLLGVMSSIRFDKIVSRYVADLEEAQKRLSIKGHAEKDLERKTSMLVENMRWLRIQTHPEEAWDKSCNLLQLLAGFFAGIHGSDIKHAYCQLFEDLLLPIGAKATSELSAAKWKHVLEILKPKVSQLLAKPKHWSQAFPLWTVILCVSPLDTFSQQWHQTALALQPKLKDRSSRSHALKALCRLVWRFIYRTPESPIVASKKLDEIVRMVFFQATGKRSFLSTEPSIADPLIQLIRIIGFRYQDFCFRTIIFPLMNSELFMSGRDLKIDALDPERMVIAIRAFLAIMSDLEKGEQPAFPASFECDALMDPYARSPHSHRRTVSQTSMTIGSRIERLSRPVMTSGFGEIAKESYVKFCKILGEITIICDNTFGGQAVLDERIAQTIPKTPMADAFATFGRRDEVLNPTDVRQNFYDLLHVAVQALPRCLSPHIPFNSLINLLCTGTAHVQSHIAASSAQSLKSIARQSHAQQVTIGFARFIFNFDDRYATMADGGLLGAQHIESTLRLYVELLEIWIEDIQHPAGVTSVETKDDDTPTNRVPAPDLSRSRVFAHVDEIESHGLFFLCSPSRHVRAFAIRVLRLVTKFDNALGQPSKRIISILEGSSQQVIDVNDEKLSTAERSRLQKGLRKSNLNSTLVELCSSDTSQDSTLWFKIFPSVIRLGQEICPQAVLLTREIVCARLSHSHKTLSMLAEPYSVDSPFAPKLFTGRHIYTNSEVTIEQWKLHLIFACTTLTNAGSQPHSLAPTMSSQHTRKTSKTSAVGSIKAFSAGELFSKVVPFLAATNQQVRVAAAVGLGTININLYRTLLEALQPVVNSCNEEAKLRLATHQRSTSSPRRNRKNDYLRTEITHLYRLTAHCLKGEVVYTDEWVLQNLITYTKDLRIFLNDEEVQHQWHFQKLRTHFCGLVEVLYETVRKTKDPARWMSFQSRKAAFSMMEDWCGYSPNQPQIRQKEESMRRSALEQEHDLNHRGQVTSAMEIEKRDLRTAALSAMAALCAGPVSVPSEGQAAIQFDMRRMLLWIDTIFETPSDKTHATGRRALRNLITHNQEHGFLLARSIEMCYLAKSQKALSSYFEVVTQVLTDNADDKTPFWKILCAALYTLGNDKSDIRMKSARLLRTLEERLQKSSKLQDLDISVSDKTTAVYKKAQFEISQRLASQHSEMAFHVFSELSIYFKELVPDHQRNMVLAMLPWLQTINLQLDPNGGPTASSYMLLVNLFEITVRSSTVLHNEVQALWQALASGPHAGNVQLVLDFIISVCLDRREQNFVEYAKQVVVFLSVTAAGSKLVDFLMLQLSPKAMTNERVEMPAVPPDLSGLPYIADLGLVLPMGNKQSGLSLGQLSLMLLVDLIVSPIQLPKDKVPLLLQTVITQWDHYMTLVQGQAREMLVHLIHELVISKIEPESTTPDKHSIEELIESIRRNDAKVVWTYEETDARSGMHDSNGVPEPMVHVIDEVVKVFAVSYNDAELGFDFRTDWAKTTLNWASSCPVRHIACRSFQIFRCILLNLDQQMLADMLARLSNTIADDENDFLTFSQEILITLSTVIGRLEPVDIIEYPQLFWVTAACLETIFEQEFQETLTMLERLLEKLDLSDPAVIKLMNESMPDSWDGDFEGLHSLVHKGLRSSMCIDRSLALLEKMVKLPPSALVGDESRLLFTVLANLPRYLHSFDDMSSTGHAFSESAETLAGVAEADGHESLAKVLSGFARQTYDSATDFLAQTVSAIRAAFFPSLEYKSLVFLMGLLNNQIPWIKIKTMQLLCVIIPDIDMLKPEIASQGPDLISPVLRLLQTSYCQQALEVLDNVMSMTGTPLDNKHIRMSMAGSHSSRATRKEYESTKSLYGIPEESGWSIPMPAAHSARTRHNVHSVFYTCANTVAENGQGLVTTPEVEFTDDQQYGSYFPDRTATMLSDDTHADGSMGDLAMKLGSLDDFFDDQVDQTTPQGRESLPRYPIGLHEDRENLYDKQTLPILHKSLNRNASVTSFQTGFADTRYTSPREPLVMNPAAFSATHSMPFPRPNLHSRSVTSPSAMLKRTPPRFQSDLTSGDEAGDETFSDDDMSLASRTNTSNDEAVIVQQAMRQTTAVRPAFSFRSGMRRLTGGMAEDKRPRDGLLNGYAQQSGHGHGYWSGRKSPNETRLAKVPQAYSSLGSNPKSAEL